MKQWKSDCCTDEEVTEICLQLGRDISYDRIR